MRAIVLAKTERDSDMATYSDEIRQEADQFMRDRWEEGYGEGGTRIGDRTEFHDGPWITEDDLAALRGFADGKLNRVDAFELVESLTQWESEKPLYDTYREGFIHGLIKNELGREPCECGDCAGTVIS